MFPDVAIFCCTAHLLSCSRKLKYSKSDFAHAWRTYRSETLGSSIKTFLSHPRIPCPSDHVIVHALSSCSSTSPVRSRVQVCMRNGATFSLMMTLYVFLHLVQHVTGRRGTQASHERTLLLLLPSQLREKATARKCVRPNRPRPQSSQFLAFAQSCTAVPVS